MEYLLVAVLVAVDQATARIVGLQQRAKRAIS